MAYTQLSQAERYRIAALLETQVSVEVIARQMKRRPTTVRSELRRGRSISAYCVVTTHTGAQGL
ncbi:MAG: helix-turn-helix domain-containing protein [Chitinimonas sp.]|nr:helix-turn-helix domain-containing protein [Chitinimonas sp.]